MLVLSLDTTTRAGSVALADGDRLIAERAGDPARTHAERLPAEILTLLAAHGRAIGDVDLFAVAIGPGSFTGLRIGIATLQGLALVRQRPVVGVPALEALAQTGSLGLAAGTRIAAWMDAHRRDVFSALYRVGSAPPFAAGHLVELDGPAVGGPAAALERWSRSGVAAAVVIGDGATMYAEIVAASGARPLAAPPLAAAIGRLGRLRAGEGHAGHPAGIQPLYVRRPDAEVNREKRGPGSWANGKSSN